MDSLQVKFNVQTHVSYCRSVEINDDSEGQCQVASGRKRQDVAFFTFLSKTHNHEGISLLGQELVPGQERARGRRHIMQLNKITSTTTVSCSLAPAILSGWRKQRTKCDIYGNNGEYTI